MHEHEEDYMAKVFVVDDAAFMRMMIRDILVRNGYSDISEAENGYKAVEKFKELNPDLVIMDITMPKWMEYKQLKK